MSDFFRTELMKTFDEFHKVVSTDQSDWTVKGFIDVYKNIYTISIDTKVVSKIVELMIFPVILKFAKDNDYEMILTSHQNHYPDITFVKGNEKIALDLKSTYRINKNQVNGMTLGAFTGYFRNRKSLKNITFPYESYTKHYILGVIYSRADIANSIRGLEELGYKLKKKDLEILEDYLSNPSGELLESLFSLLKVKEQKTKEQITNILDAAVIDERKTYTVEDLPNILSVVKDFDFFVQEKWKIASDKPGSGNTKNIGSTKIINELKNGNGLFTNLENGEDIFNDYWMYYLTKDMAKNVDLETPPYNNIATYLEYKGSK